MWATRVQSQHAEHWPLLFMSYEVSSDVSEAEECRAICKEHSAADGKRTVVAECHFWSFLEAVGASRDTELSWGASSEEVLKEMRQEEGLSDARVAGGCWGPGRAPGAVRERRVRGTGAGKNHRMNRGEWRESRGVEAILRVIKYQCRSEGLRELKS